MTMSLPKYQDLEKLSEVNEIEKEIFLLTKELLNLRIKKATNQTVKSHLFTHTKRRLSQLNFKRASLLKEKN